MVVLERCEATNRIRFFLNIVCSSLGNWSNGNNSTPVAILKGLGRFCLKPKNYYIQQCNNQTQISTDTNASTINCWFILHQDMIPNFIGFHCIAKSADNYKRSGYIIVSKHYGLQNTVSSFKTTASVYFFLGLFLLV